MNQTYPNLELVIADDGSDDPHTLAILHQQTDPRVRVLFLEHKGVSHARNEAIRQAVGQYILPLDSDDLIEPEYLAAGIRCLESNPEVGIVYAKADFFEAVIGAWDLGDYSIGKMLTDNLIFNAAVFRKADFEHTSGYDESLTCMEDWDEWLSFIELGLRPVRLDKLYFHYRKHQQSQSAMQQKTTYEEVYNIYAIIVKKHLPLYRQYVDDFAYNLQKRLVQKKGEVAQLKHRIEESWNWRSDAEENRWIRLGQQIPWSKLDEKYKGLLPELGGMQYPVQLVLGIVIIQVQLNCDDIELLCQLNENPYMRAFCGLPDDKMSFPDNFMAYVHEKVTETMLQQVNQIIKSV